MLCVLSAGEQEHGCVVFSASSKQGLLQCLLQFSYDDVLERLKSQSAALVQALGGNGTLGGSADETALDQVRAANCQQFT